MLVAPHERVRGLLAYLLEVIVSERAVAWAKAQVVGNAKAKKMLMILAGASGDDGVARIGADAFLGVDGLDTKAQVERTVNVLKDQGILSTYFDFSTHRNVYQLKLPSPRQERE